MSTKATLERISALGRTVRVDMGHGFVYEGTLAGVAAEEAVIEFPRDVECPDGRMRKRVVVPYSMLELIR